LDTSAGLVEQFIHVFREHYRYLGRDPRLLLQAVQEASFLPRPERTIADSDVAEYQERRRSLRKRISELVADHQRRGTVVGDIDVTDVTEITTAMYVTEVRQWLISINQHQGPVSIVAGLEQLSRRLGFALSSAIVKSGKPAGAQARRSKGRAAGLIDRPGPRYKCAGASHSSIM
jgi:hypothetical protein